MAEKEMDALVVTDRRASAEPAPCAPREGGLLAIVRGAIDRGTAPELLDRLLDLQLRWEANEARKLFVAAVARFKAHAPAVLPKDSEVDFKTDKGRTHYLHATLGGILHSITPHLSQEGLSVRWRTEQMSDSLKVTGLLEHEAGHFEEVSLTGPLDKSGNKNALQAIGSTATYLQRYTLTALLGISTGEVDDDAASSVAGRPPAPAPSQDITGPRPIPKRARDAIDRFATYGIDGRIMERWVGKPPEEWGESEFGALKDAWQSIVAAGPKEPAVARLEAAKRVFGLAREPGQEG